MYVEDLGKAVRQLDGDFQQPELLIYFTKPELKLRYSSLVEVAHISAESLKFWSGIGKNQHCFLLGAVPGGFPTPV